MNCPLYGVRLVRERSIRYSARKVGNSDRAARVILDALIGNTDREHFAAIFLDNATNVLGAHIVAVGSIDRIGILTPREVFRAAIIAGATMIVLGHNHPSGDPHPSEDDHTTTAAIVEASRVIGIPIIDHIIVTRTGDHYSFLDHGRMP